LIAAPGVAQEARSGDTTLVEVHAEAATARVPHSGGDLASQLDAQVRIALALPAGVRRAPAEAADSLARVWLADEPDASDAHYWRAVTAGVLAEVVGAREKVRLGRAAWEHAVRALELKPGHAGAHHMLGRIHAGVRRLGWVTRFVASRMGMGELIAEASWEMAEVHLGQAVALAPEEPSHHLELALLLLDLGRPVEARPHLQAVTALPVRDELDAQIQARARGLLADPDR
jgi:hypothetical protein